MLETPAGAEGNDDLIAFHEEGTCFLQLHVGIFKEFFLRAPCKRCMMAE